jgi:hypothetical protein
VYLMVLSCLLSVVVSSFGSLVLRFMYALCASRSEQMYQSALLYLFCSVLSPDPDQGTFVHVYAHVHILQHLSGTCLVHSNVF